MRAAEGVGPYDGVLKREIATGDNAALAMTRELGAGGDTLTIKSGEVETSPFSISGFPVR